jgi:hypothetical protein
MSTHPTYVLPSILVGESVKADEDRRTFERAIRELLRRGFYCRVSSRVDLRTARLNRWQRTVYVWLCRRMPSSLRLPAAPLEEMGGLASFAAADAECKTPDDVLQVFPFGWTYGRGKRDPEIACRPRDESDTENYDRLKSIFGVAANDRPLIGAVELRALLEEVAQCRRMAAPRAKKSE